MMQKKSWDLVVMGAGIAGLTAAVRASERGLKVLLLESGEHDLYLCNSHFTGGAFHIAFHDIMRLPKIYSKSLSKSRKALPTEAWQMRWQTKLATRFVGFASKVRALSKQVRTHGDKISWLPLVY
jgi:flavin-dependent dehydrogenase